MTCLNDQIVRLESSFKQIKASLSKEQNGVDWPYLHTPYTKNIDKSDPQEIEFSKSNKMNSILTDFVIDDLPEEKQKTFLSMEFVNRPLFCRIRLTGLHKTNNDGQCDSDIFEKVSEPICYYKVCFRLIFIREYR